VAGFLFTFAGMKRLCVIGIFVLLVFAACTSKAKVPEPAVAEHGRSVEGPTSELSTIDSLIWQQPDSTLVLLLEYLSYRDAMIASSNDAMDTMKRIQCVSTTFDNHYAQLLASELLFKNYYAQSNRTEVLKAVGYFDSIVNVADGRNADARGASPQRGASVQKRDAFLAARAHYINGVGYYERDSLIEACQEYLNTLRMMKSHFAENELVDKKAWFMALTYNRLGELFSAQFMQEPAIYCYKEALAYDRIAQVSPDKIANILYHLGKQYDKLNEADSAACCYEKALELLTERNALLYRDLISVRALFEYSSHNDTVNSLDSLKRMTAQATNETERLNRYMIIGGIYQDMGQYDSAKAYFEPVLEFEKESGMASVSARALREIAMSEGDTLKANQYATMLIEKNTTAAEKQAQVSKLNDMFQNYLQEKQEAASLREQRKAVRITLAMVMTLVVIAAVVVILMRRSHRKRMAANEAESQRRLNEALQRHGETERELQTKMEQAAQHTKEVLQQRAKAIYHSEEDDKLQRIMAEFETTYPRATEKLQKVCPDLSETERKLAILTFLRLRAKEEAELLGLSENTVRKYRSALYKKLDLGQFSVLVE
jgi:tetratricopeptide (TPR) repeat protein